MTARRFITPRFVALLAAAIVVLQFAAVQHAAAHGGAAPDVGCEFCLSGAGHAPTTACSSRLAKARPCTGAKMSSLSSSSSQVLGSSAMVVMRARTSSPRFVSCVESAFIACGHSACRLPMSAWKSAGSIENTSGSPPTSLRLVSRE